MPSAIHAAVMRDTLAAFNARGALLVADVIPRVSFAFIHGGGALDDSRDSGSLEWQWCGVDLELQSLRKLGCFADLTFPAFESPESEPLIKDSIFYMRDDLARASYRNPANVKPVEVNQLPWGDLMGIEGPDCATLISPESPVEQHAATIARMDEWVGHNIHVVGRDDWVFVKVCTRGASFGELTPGSPEWNVFFGSNMQQFYSDIEHAYNDGVNWKLHYVSAREMYNIIKAAEAGLGGDPNQYRDYLVPPYANQRILSGNRYRLHSYSTGMVVVENIEPEVPMEFSFRQYTPSCIVEECARINGWRWELYSGSECTRSDATVSPGAFGELHFIDRTPGRYYRIKTP